MPEIEPTRRDFLWERLTHTLTAKLIGSLLGFLLITFALLGYLNIRLHRQHLEAATLTSAERVSDVIRRSATYYMLRNDREGLYRAIQTMADEPGMVKVRIFDQEGRISYSTDPKEVSHIVDKSAEACYGCHSRSQPLARLDRPDRFRIYRSDTTRVLGIITPIENQPSCANAECHAHPASQQVLGVLDTNLSLAKADEQLKASTERMFSYTAAAMLLVGVLSWILVWEVVGAPVGLLKRGTEQLSKGDLGYQISVGSEDELGELAKSFNTMSVQLRSANEELVRWAKTLEDRVDDKTAELKRAHQHMLHVEKMASLGKLAAVVAHEVNNPLAGILTYSKLLRKWVATGQAGAEKRDEAMECLDLIASESMRCGDLIKNLLTLSRTAPMHVQITEINAVIRRSLLLVRNQLEQTGIQAQLSLPPDLPLISCDPAQIEQVLIALIMNAIDAMPRGGNLWIETRLNPGKNQKEDEVEITVRDDGSGIAAEILPNIFDPFLTTKEIGRGVGLGLAISRGIVERHNGRIEVESELGRGTAFTIMLPTPSREAAIAAAGGSNSATKTR